MYNAPQPKIEDLPTSTQLRRSTIIAAMSAVTIGTMVYLPAEYGSDPTGIGSILGLARMGEIKKQLYAEAEADELAASQTTTALSTPEPDLASRQDAIDGQLTAMALAVEVDRLAAAPPPEPVADAPEQVIIPTPQTVPDVTDTVAPVWRDEVSYTLAPTEGVEVKLVMEAGAIAEFYWTTNGAVVAYDTHGDGDSSISYEKGRGVADQTGTLTAAFDGNHGWFWRNRTEAPVTITLFVRGDYSEMKFP
jgi:hypothetical protein